MELGVGKAFVSLSLRYGSLEYLCGLTWETKIKVINGASYGSRCGRLLVLEAREESLVLKSRSLALKQFSK